jgi:hypothetical protein
MRHGRRNHIIIAGKVLYTPACASDTSDWLRYALSSRPGAHLPSRQMEDLRKGEAFDEILMIDYELAAFPYLRCTWEVDRGN